MGFYSDKLNEIQHTAQLVAGLDNDFFHWVYLHSGFEADYLKPLTNVSEARPAMADVIRILSNEDDTGWLSSEMVYMLLGWIYIDDATYTSLEDSVALNENTLITSVMGVFASNENIRTCRFDYSGYSLAELRIALGHPRFRDIMSLTITDIFSTRTETVTNVLTECDEVSSLSPLREFFRDSIADACREYLYSLWEYSRERSLGYIHELYFEAQSDWKKICFGDKVVDCIPSDDLYLILGKILSFDETAFKLLGGAAFTSSGRVAKLLDDRQNRVMAYHMELAKEFKRRFDLDDQVPYDSLADVVFICDSDSPVL